MEGFVSPTNEFVWTQEENIPPFTGEVLSSVSLSSRNSTDAQRLADTINASINRGNAPPNDITEANDNPEEQTSKKSDWTGGGGIIALRNYLNDVYPDKKMEECDKVTIPDPLPEKTSSTKAPTAPPRTSSIKTVTSAFLPIRPLPSSKPLSEVTSLPFSKVVPILSCTQASKEMAPPSLTLRVTVTPINSRKHDLSLTSSSTSASPISLPGDSSSEPPISTSISSTKDDFSIISKSPAISTAGTTFPSISAGFTKHNFVQTNSTSDITTGASNYTVLDDIDIEHTNTNDDVLNDMDTGNSNMLTDVVNDMDSINSDNAGLKSCLKSGRKSGRVLVRSRSESPSKRTVNFKAYDTVNYFVTPDEVLETDFPYELIDNEERTGIIQFDDSTEETFSIVHFSSKTDANDDIDSPYEIMDFHRVEEGGRKGVIVSLKPMGATKQSEASVNNDDVFTEPTDKILYPTLKPKDSIEAPVKVERGRQKYQDKRQLKSKKKRAQSLNPFSRKRNEDSPQRRLSVFEPPEVNPTFSGETSNMNCNAVTQTAPKTDTCAIM